MMSELSPALLSDLDVVADWIGSERQARYWAGPRVTYPIDRERLPQQVEWSQALSFCLWSEGQTMGFGQILRKPARRLHLARLIVSPAHRGSGYGRALAVSLVDQALARGPGVVSLNVFADNTAAVELYRRIGFVAAEREPDNAQPPMRYMVYRT